MSKLGPIQKKWVESLRAHPERQMDSELGRKSGDGTYKACCLREGGLIAGVCEWWNDSLHSADGNNEALVGSYQALGLFGDEGQLKNTIYREGASFCSLAEMNDDEWTWPEIADYIEANPENVFERHV